MNDDRLLLEMRRWLQEERVALPDAEEAGQQIASRLPTTRQRRRRLWGLPSIARTLESPSTRDTTEYQPTPIPPSNGHTPTVIRRTQSMLSPVKAITAGALVFAIGGAFLIAQPFDQQPATGPGAATEADAVPMEPAWVTGTLLHAPACTPPERTVDGDVVHEVGYRCESQIWETDDARLSGKATPSWSADVYRLGPDASVLSTTWEVETDSGRWLCSSGPTVAQGSGLSASTDPQTILCKGQDAYADLAAVLDVDVDAGSVEGLVFAGSVPTAPKPVAE